MSSQKRRKLVKNNRSMIHQGQTKPTTSKTILQKHDRYRCPILSVAFFYYFHGYSLTDEQFVLQVSKRHQPCQSKRFFLLRGVESQQSSIGILELGVDGRVEIRGVNNISSHFSILIYSITCKKYVIFLSIKMFELMG